MSKKTRMRHPSRTSAATGQQEQESVTPAHSFLGILSCLLPLANLAVLVPGIPTLSLLVTSLGVIFVYGLAPVAILAGFVIAIVELRRKDSKRLFPVLGLIFNFLALIALLFTWFMALSVGYPFVCIDKPAFCFN